MEVFKVFIYKVMAKAGLDILENNGCKVSLLKSWDKETLIEQVRGVDAMIILPGFIIDKEILDIVGPQLKVIGTHSVGYDHINVEECKRRGIKVCHTPFVTDYAVADIAVLLLLGAARRVQEARIGFDEGKFLYSLMGKDIKDSTVGIIGLGSIGQAIIKRLKGFEVKAFLYTGHREKPEGRELAATFVSLDTLLQESDHVIMSAPLTEETKGMCDKEFFRKMKNTAVFVNISRGQIVQQDCLIEALKSGEIFAAGLDVMTPEPPSPDDELLKLPNVVLTPHLGSATGPARTSMTKTVAENVIRGLKGQPLLNPVPNSF